MPKNRFADYKLIRDAFGRHGYQFFAGDFNLNLFGIRTGDRRADSFNDWIGVAFEQAGAGVVFVFQATTDPGIYWRKNPQNIEGTAILVPGQYLGAYGIGLHHGEYPALVQRKPVRVYRDANYDDVLDWEADDPQASGLFGINIHRAKPDGRSTVVGKWSAGCQVVACGWDFDYIMATANRATKEWGGSFSYTLFEEREIYDH